MVKRSKKKAGFGKKTPSGVFSFCANYYLKVAIHSYDRIERRRTNILTIMSFCLIAEMTFCAACFDEIQKNSIWIAMLGVQLLLWIAAYGIVVVTRMKNKEVFFYPGQDEGISFAPSYEGFFNSKISYKEPEYYFAREYFKKTPKSKSKGKASKPMSEDLLSDKGVYEQYKKKLKEDDDLICFNENLCLASSLMTYMSANKLIKVSGKWFWLVYILFGASLVIFFLMIIFMLCLNLPSA